MRVVVVGAGVVGASVAYHLVTAGAEVTLVERASAPGRGVTAASFGWIGDTTGDWPGGAADLRPYVRADHDRLAADVPGIPLRWTGSLIRPGAASAGPGQRIVDSREIEPRLRAGPYRALWTPTDGAVDPVAMSRALVDEAGRRGARLVRTGGAALEAAERVVLCAGTGVPALAATFGARVPVGRSPATSIRATAPPGLVRTVVATDDFEVRESRPGHLLMTSPHRPGDAVARVRAAFGADVELRGWAVGVRPMPPDGPAIGPITADGRVHVAVMHSAVTLAPTAGRLLAGELLTGRPAAALRRCRPRPR